jgi:hypothetical protein
MVAEATVDCYNDCEHVTGLYTMLDEHLDVPFQTCVAGVDATVTGIDLSDDEQIVAICARGRWRKGSPSSICRCRRLRRGCGVDRGIPPLAEVGRT